MENKGKLILTEIFPSAQKHIFLVLIDSHNPEDQEAFPYPYLIRGREWVRLKYYSFNS